jgi:hypothetical protein
MARLSTTIPFPIGFRLIRLKRARLEALGGDRTTSGGVPVPLLCSALVGGSEFAGKNRHRDKAQRCQTCQNREEAPVLPFKLCSARFSRMSLVLSHNWQPCLVDRQKPCQIKDIFAVRYEPVKHLPSYPPSWRSAFCGRQNTLPSAIRPQPAPARHQNHRLGALAAWSRTQ